MCVFHLYTLNPKLIEVMILILFFSGASITACRATGRHIVALEPDKKIFAGVLQHMKKSILPVAAAVVTEVPAVVESQDPDAMVVQVRKFVRRDRTSK
jgi:hypothetical protein